MMCLSRRLYHVITRNIALLLPRSTPHCAVSHDHVIRTGRIPSVRTEMTYPLAFSFITMVLFSGIVFNIRRNVQSIRVEAVTIVAWILIIAIGWNQALITSRIFYTENVVFNQDVLTVQAIKSRIDELGLGERPKEPVVFVGNHVAKAIRIVIRLINSVSQVVLCSKWVFPLSMARESRNSS